MRYLSVCSGIEAASQAWMPLGWKPVAFSEIEPFPCSVLKHRHPNVPNLGDMTKYENWELPSTIDLLTGGTPCQSFSVAGLRKGLDDPRGNLMLTFGGIAAKFRPRWIVWENVPGVLSSNEGKDFAAFLGLLSGRHVSPPPAGWGNSGVLAGESNAYGLAWRTTDAQYFGVPQRRRRPFVIGYLGDWRRAAAVLFERHCLQGNPPPRREARKGTSRGFETGPSGGSLTDLAPTLDARCKDGPIRNQLGIGVVEPVAKTLLKGGHGNNPLDENLVAVPIDMRNALRGDKALDSGGGVGKEGDPAFSVTKNVQAVAFNSREDPCVTGDVAGALGSSSPQAQAIAIQNATRGKDQNGLGVARPDEPMFTLDQGSQHGVAFGLVDGNGSEELMPTLTIPSVSGGGHPAAVAFNFNKSGNEGSSLGISEDKTDCLRADIKAPFAVHMSGMAVRRLTPLECERLQGFPDDHTLVPHNGKLAADGPRYKALGNSWAVPCARWIGQRIQMVEELPIKLLNQ